MDGKLNSFVFVRVCVLTFTICRVILTNTSMQSNPHQHKHVYGRYVEGTGSVLQCCMETEMDSVFGGLDQCSEEEKLQRLLKLKLRYFTPREVANLMGFPQSFSFPEQISTRQQYRVLGNSLNVVVVARLLHLLVS